ncbi:MAG: glycosyltransferase N-terminal domain-containing protein [Nitrospinota bacterium]|nr:glycosyltransferase N-terminal domain-containing protein [Nitrospinota bacterium]
MLVLYHIIVNAAFLAASPFILVRTILDSAFRHEMLQRLRGGSQAPQATKSIWIHAASVGEVQAARIFWQILKKDQPELPLVLSTFTAAGYQMAKKEGLDPVFRMPPDSPIWIDPLFGKLDPALLVLIEAELWPGLLGACGRRGIPVVLINGRISQKAFQRYMNFQGIFQQLMKPVSVFSMRTKTDCQRVLDLGIEPEKVRVTGNLKFEALIPEDSGEDEALPVDQTATVVFGSTRPGDEGPVMETVSRLWQDLPQFQCVLAPRHIERCEEVEGLIRDYGFKYIRHSKINGSQPEPSEVILVDTIGDLNSYYQKSCLAFVGGGFNPRFGGHNILEPAAYSQPVIYGKYMSNFEEEACLLAASGGGVPLDSPDELYPTLLRLLKDPEERIRRGKAAKEMVKTNMGAGQRNLDLVKKFL